MITSMRGCVACNDLWPWHISSRSFNHDFPIKLLKYGTSCHVCSIACTDPNGFFPYLTQMITSMRGCVVCNDIWLSLISSRSFSYYLAIKLLKYGPSCCVCSAALKVLHEFFLYLAQMITSIRRCVACNDLWPSPISWRLFSCEIAYFMDYIHVVQIQTRRGGCAMYHFQVNRSKVKVIQVIQIFAVWGGGYPSVRPSVCRQNRVLAVTSLIFTGPPSYLTCT